MSLDFFKHVPARKRPATPLVNASLNWASIVGIVLAVGGAFLYFMRNFKPALARDYDVFFAAIGLLCGGILVLFTDIEVKVVRWVNCGPLAIERDRDSDICR